MDFVDKTLLKFGMPGGATGLLDDLSLSHIVGAGYRIDPDGLDGPLTPRFDALEFGGLQSVVSAELDHEGYRVGHSATSRPDRPGSNANVDVIWRGSISAGAVFPKAEIGMGPVKTLSLDDLDNDIAGPLPADPSALEQARRAALLARLQGGSHDSEAFSANDIEVWLSKTGSQSLSNLIEAKSPISVPLGQWVLSFTPLPGTVAPIVTEFPVISAVMIRDPAEPGFRIADFLSASRFVRQQMHIQGMTPKVISDRLPLGRPAIVWAVPQSWFDDADWPGGAAGNAAAKRTDRIEKASAWLMGQGIALAVQAP